MKKRTDISSKVIHFTKDSENYSAIDNFLSIVQQRRIFGGTGMIKGKFPCICFTEAPIESLRDSFSKRSKSRYSNFGFMFDKSYIYAQGGRPVIYQSLSEYESLSESMKWRHVTYDPTIEKPVDFTWEREWRIQAEIIKIDPENVTLVVPNELAEKLVINEHELEQYYQMEWNKIMIGDEYFPALYGEPFRWSVTRMAK